MEIVQDFVGIVIRDLIFVGLLVACIVPLSKYKTASFAVLKRNFIGYFNNPTGYVFLCLFVLLTSFAAFWPHEFFNSNLATLDQLNAFLPYIMLIFIPAITMSIWAEERRQGTDELLLTIPAADIDIVLGKYLAAASIFTASLLFSQLANFMVLNSLALGGVDVGLFFTTYLGFWLVGLAMLAIGMVASFLTNNLTVGFILGAAFNAPLVFAYNADVIIGSTNLAQQVSRWSMTAQFEDFGRGVMSLSSVTFFVTIVAVGMYLSMVLIGRRHWMGGKDGSSLLPHYLARSTALVALAFAATWFFTDHDWVRHDATTQKISSVSYSTTRLIDQLDLDRPVYIEAYISRTLPEAFIKTKYDIVSLLREIKAQGGGKVNININDQMEAFSPEAQQAEERHGIRPMTVQSVEHGAIAQERVFLSAVFSCGLERVVIPFFGHGSSVEYEIVRSIVTVAQESSKSADTQSRRRRVGILRTDAELAGTPQNDFMAMMRGGQFPQQSLIRELEKQYELDRDDTGNVIYHDRGERIPGGFLFAIDAKFADELDAWKKDAGPADKNGKDQPNEIERKLSDELRTEFYNHFHELSDKATVTVETTGENWKVSSEDKRFEIKLNGKQLDVREKYKYDVLLVVQPSSLTQPQMDTLLDGIQRGQPTLIFEDPLLVSYVSPPSRVPGTDEPKPMSPHNPMMGGMQQPPEPKGNIKEFWKKLGTGLAQAKRGVLEQDQRMALRPNENARKVVWRPFTSVVWQDYNPYPKVRGFGEFVVFANTNAAIEKEDDVFNTDEPAVSGLDEVAFLTPGSLVDRTKDEKFLEANLKFIPLVRLAGQTGVLDYSGGGPTGSSVLLKEVDVDDNEPEDEPLSLKHEDLTAAEGRLKTSQPYVLAARIRHKTKEEMSAKDSKEKSDQKNSAEIKDTINVIVVADVDVLGSSLLTFRNQPSDIDFRFQNAAFVLNLLDAVAGDDRFLDIRKRQADHGSLKLVEDLIRQARENMVKGVEDYEKDLNDKRREAANKRKKIVDDLQAELDELAKKTGTTDSRAMSEAEDKLRRQIERNKKDTEDQEEDLKLSLTRKLEQEERQLNLDKLKIQNQYKFWAVVLPPIPPLLVGLIVFVRRRLREREGVSRSRLK